MRGSFVVLTGASGVGKTTIALAIKEMHPEILVFRSDAIVGVPSPEAMAARYGVGPRAGEAWQRDVTLQWMERIAPILLSGQPVVLDLQMRIAFILEALEANNIKHARVILVECDDETRTARLTYDRKQPELANESMNSWSQYLHQEALDAGLEIIDTSAVSVAESVARIVSSLSL